MTLRTSGFGDSLNKGHSLLRSGGTILENKSKDDIQRKHPLVDIFSPEWIKYLDSYEGGLAFTKNTIHHDSVSSALEDLESSHNLREYLRQHKREKAADFEKRKTRTHYENYCRQVIDFWVSAIFRERQVRTAPQEEVNDFWMDVDGKRTDIQDFMREKVATLGQIFGWCAVLVDMPNPPELQGKSDITQAEAERFNLKPRMKVISPLDVVTWQTDAKGDFIFFRYKQRFFDRFGRPTVHLKTWTPTEWALHNFDGKKIDGSEHDFGVVPIVAHHNLESKKYDTIGISAISDIADININIFNLASLIDEFAYDAAFPIMYMEMRQEEKELIRRYGLNRALGVPREASISPDYISPPTDPYRFLIKWVKHLIAEIERISRQKNFSKSGDAVDRRSGVKTEIDKEISDSVLAKKASNLENTEEKIVEFVLLETNNFSSIKEFRSSMRDVKIEYNKRFDFKALSQEFNELMKIGQFIPESDRLVKEKKKNIVKKLVRNPEIRKEIIDTLSGEINSALNQPQDQQSSRQGVTEDMRDSMRDSMKEEDN